MTGKVIYTDSLHKQRIAIVRHDAGDSEEYSFLINERLLSNDKYRHHWEAHEEAEYVIRSAVSAVMSYPELGPWYGREFNSRRNVTDIRGAQEFPDDPEEAMRQAVERRIELL
jgi:hypothetical protein